MCGVAGLFFARRGCDVGAPDLPLDWAVGSRVKGHATDAVDKHDARQVAGEILHPLEERVFITFIGRFKAQQDDRGGGRSELDGGTWVGAGYDVRRGPDARVVDQLDEMFTHRLAAGFVLHYAQQSPDWPTIWPNRKNITTPRIVKVQGVKTPLKVPKPVLSWPRSVLLFT